jgi:hypothetical protein
MQPPIGATDAKIARYHNNPMLRRLGRYLRTTLAVVMVLLWLAVIGLWIRSYWRGDQLHLQSHKALPQPGPLRDRELTRDWLLYSGHGGICLATRALDTLSNPFPRSDPPWQSSPDPSYPEPWAGNRTATLSIGSIARNSPAPVSITVQSGALSLAPPPSSQPVDRLIEAGKAGASTAPSGFTLTTGTSGGASITVSGSSTTVVTVSPGVGSGSISTGTGATSSGSSLTMAGSGPARLSGITVSSGTLVLSNVQWTLPLPPPKPSPPPGFRFVAYRAGEATDWLGKAYVIVFPFWVLVIGAGLLMLLALRSEARARLRRWRARNGMCLNCGYDLRASSERCPECGMQMSLSQLYAS